MNLCVTEKGMLLDSLVGVQFGQYQYLQFLDLGTPRESKKERGFVI